MTRVHPSGTPSGTRRRRVLTAAALLAAGPVIWATVVGSAAASITGYGLVGPDPATQLGLSVPVLTAEVSGPGGSTVRAVLADATISVTRPAGYSAGSQVVSLTDLSGPGPAEALLPAELLEGSHVLLGVGVGVRPVETGETDALDVPVGEDPAVAAEPDSLAMQVESPSLAGATVVVVGEDRSQVVADGTSVTLELDGPSAVFALAAGAAPVGTAMSGAEVGPEGQAGSGQAVDGTSAAAEGPSAGSSAGTATFVGALLLGSAVVVGSGVALAGRSARRRAQP